MDNLNIKGLIWRDNTGWQKELCEKMQKNKYGVIWKDQISDFSEVMPALMKILNSKNFFYLYNIANNKVNYRFRIIDFAIKEDYNNKKSTEWKNKSPNWYKEYFKDYCDEKRCAKAVFLSDEMKFYQTETISYKDFITYKNRQASQRNAVAYIELQTLHDKKMKEYLDLSEKLLKQNHNLILTGAPGTGKTYRAKQIAAQLILKKEFKEDSASEEDKTKMKEQCGFVQFHPSYDYTDFVEGLRPKNENGNIGFERKDGVFKEFCSRALKGLYNKRSDNFDEVWNLLVSQIDNNDYIEIDLLRGKNKIRIELNEYGDGLANRTYEDNNYKKGEWIRGQSKFFSKEQCYNVYKGLNGTPSGGHDNYRKAIVNYMKKELGLLEYKEGEKIEGDATRLYVFIIDEINRGEISKIFGELFFAIDPGYRGAEKCSDLRTQYANLQKSQNTFDEILKITDANNYGHFFVPENVYIIGTMNDIDRSVESMDFAFRRRFAFKEVTADDSKAMLDDLAWKDEAVKRMDSLNAAIEEIEGLSSAYHIGASYFLKLKNYNGDFSQLWDCHLKGLLFEYLRGTQSVDENMQKLEKAYNLTNTAADDSDTNN